MNFKSLSFMWYQRDTPTMMDIIFSNFLVLYQFFHSPQVKRSVIIRNKHGICELIHEVPNDLRLRISEN